MPIRRGKDKYGSFYQWGNSGKKYYYRLKDIDSRKIAYDKAVKQAQAIFASGYRSPK